VVSFTTRPLHPQGKDPLNLWLTGPQSPSRRGGEEKTFHHCTVYLLRRELALWSELFSWLDR
jgi:hypothetical protein